MSVKICTDCKYCVENIDYPNLSQCSRPWVCLISGRKVWSGGEETIPCWQARKQFCGTTGIGFENKEMELIC